jgi:hypothetical protein
LDWDEVMGPLSDVSWLWGYLFSAYIAFCTFAVLNVMTGVFVQSAMESASRDHELLSQSMIIDRERHVEAITRLFRRIDTTSSGSITLLEFEANLSDDAVKAFLAELELQVTDAWSLFKLLDSEGHGCVEISDFVDGCLKLKGPAKSVDIACLLHENKKLKKKLADMEESEQRTEEMLADIWESMFEPGDCKGNASTRPASPESPRTPERVREDRKPGRGSVRCWSPGPGTELEQQNSSCASCESRSRHPVDEAVVVNRKRHPHNERKKKADDDDDAARQAVEGAARVDLPGTLS